MDALEHALPQQPRLPRQPKIAIGLEELFVGHHFSDIAGGLEDNGGDVEFVEANVKDCIIELASELQRPECRAKRGDTISRWRRHSRAPPRDRGNTRDALEGDT